MSYERNPDGTYVDLEYTKFPAVVDSWQNHTDVTTSTLSAANQYRIAIQNGNLINAQALLNNYPDLRKTIITADDINKIKQAVMALERYYTDDVQSYIISYSNTASSSAKSAQESMKAASNSEVISKAKAQDAKTSADDASNSALSANKKAQEAASSATAAAQAKTAAAGSASSADTSAKAAAKSAAEAKAAASTDKTLTMDGAPADAKATGDALAKRYTKQEADAKLDDYYTKEQADAKFGTPATADQLGPVKVGAGLGVTNDGALSVTSVNGFTVKAQTTDPGVGSALDTGTVLLVYA